MLALAPLAVLLAAPAAALVDDEVVDPSFYLKAFEAAPMCGQGKAQSPIDVQRSRVADLPEKCAPFQEHLIDGLDLVESVTLYGR